MKKLTILFTSLIISTTLLSAEEDSKKKHDFSDYMLKHLKIDDVDMDLLDVGKEVERSPLEDPKLATAVVYKLQHSSAHHFRARFTNDKCEKGRPKVVMYKWKFAKIEEIQKSKKYLMEVTQNHKNENIVMSAYATLGGAFYEQQDVVLWLLEQLYKPIEEEEDSDLRASILNAIIMVTGDKYKVERTIAIKSLLGHPILRQRYNALKVMLVCKITDHEFLPDVIACFTTSGESGKTNKLLGLLLNEYDVNDLVPYYLTLKQASKYASPRSKIDRLLIKITASKSQ